MVIELIKGVALLLAVALVHKYVIRLCMGRPRLCDAACGLMFGGLCLVVMSTPVELTPGVIFDPRSVVLSLAGLFSGPVGGLIAGAVAGSYRLWIGGSGAVVGVSVVVLCVLAGLAFRAYLARGNRAITLGNLLLFGFTVHIAVIGLFTQLPADVVDAVLANIALPILLAFTPGTAMLGLLLQDNIRTAALRESLLETTEEALDAKRRLQNAYQDLQDKQKLIDEHSIYSETDRNGRIIAVNDLLCQLSGYSREELIGQNHRIMGSGEHPPDFYEAMWRTITNGKIWRGVIKNRTKDGRHFYLKSTIVPKRDGMGDIIGYAAIRTDVTDDMERQNEAIAARNAALEADAAKSNFIATMSHELRTPLNAILGFSDVIRQEIMGPLGHHKYREYIEDIHFSAEALKEMVDDVLNISRVDLNGFEFHDEEYDIVAHSDSIVRRFMPIAKNRNIQLLTTVDEDFPRFLVGDPRVQQHIQNNLLSNAIKFSRDGGTVRIAFQTAGAEEIMISISDSGHGMSEDLIERLGEPFLRENKPHIAKGTQDGVGLGFYITKSLVEARGGRIEVESELGVGTVVRAIYPRSAFPQPPSTTRSRSDDTPDEVLAG